MPNSRSFNLNLPNTRNTPIRKAARRLRWFISAFNQHIEELSTETGLEYSIDNNCLRQVFLDWVKKFEQQKPTVDTIKQLYITYPAALMLQELIISQPVKVNSVVPEQTPEELSPANFWPEGYAYVVFCMNVRAAVVAEQLDLKAEPSAQFSDIKTWWSFRENAEEDPSTIIGFFQLMVGEEPKWHSPGVFDAKNAEQNAKRLYEVADKLVDNSDTH